jgi:hypothetical protein
MERTKTNKLVNEKLKPTNDAWIIRGKVTDKKNNPVAGLIVSAYDKDLLFDDVLGTTSTDENGNFEVIYREESFRDLFDKKPDIYLKILDITGKILYTSRKKIRFDARRIEHFTIKI